MNICLGNIQFNQVEYVLGYKLTLEDKKIWDKYHNNSADLSGKKESFHVFDMPKSIRFKGEGAKNAIMKMFTIGKLVNQLGTFSVYEQK